MLQASAFRDLFRTVRGTGTAVVCEATDRTSGHLLQNQMAAKTFGGEATRVS